VKKKLRATFRKADEKLDEKGVEKMDSEKAWRVRNSSAGAPQSLQKSAHLAEK
jgi:hypothetical protein